MIVSLADRLGDVKPYYFVQKLEQIREMIAAGKDVISFGIGSPDLSPSESTIKALYNNASQKNTHGYQPYKGIPELRAAMADFYNTTYGLSINPTDNVLPLMGSKEGILHTTLAFVNPGDNILVPNPGYPTYTSLSKLLGANINYYDLNEKGEWYPDFDQLEQLVDSKTKLIWVNYPHMPTGTPARKDIFEKLVAFAKKHKVLLCHDNPYSLVLNKNKPLSILSIPGAEDVAIEFNSMSKSHNMAGWRIGMLIGAKEYVDAALRVKSNIDSGMFQGLQKAAIEALELDDAWHTERNETYNERREWIFKIFDKLGFEYNPNQVGMFVWAKPLPKTQIDSIPDFIDNLLEEKHIFFTPGMIFGSNGNGYMRASVCVPVEKIKQAYQRL